MGPSPSTKRYSLKPMPQRQTYRYSSNGLMGEKMPTWDSFVEWSLEQAAEVGGRRALRRRWATLRKLAQETAERIPPAEVIALLGKPYEQLDPEHNDLKALVAY